MTGLNVHEMSDRELRIYKRQIKKRRELRRRQFLLLVATAFAILYAFSYQSFKTYAKDKAGDIEFKYYTNVTVAYGESAWDLADRYIDYNHYKDKAHYVEELNQINHLDDESTVYAGQMLIVPYFSNEYK